MNNTPKISIIIPVYKVERYLRQCLDSVLSQTFTDWECLLVDDGSPDASGAICDEYAARDPRFRAFHQPNAGVSAARNTGLDEARGELICFIDSDDWVKPEHLANYICAGDYDIIVCGYNRVDEVDGQTRVEKLRSLKSECVDDFWKVLRSLQKDKVAFNSPWNKLYKKEIIDAFDVKFKEDISCGEDKLFNFNYLSRCRTIQISSSVTYNYRINDGSVMRQNYRDVDELKLNICYSTKAFGARTLPDGFRCDLEDDITHLYCLLGRMLYFPFRLRNKTERIETLKKIFSRNKLHPTIESRKFCRGNVFFVDLFRTMKYYLSTIMRIFKSKLKP